MGGDTLSTIRNIYIFNSVSSFKKGSKESLDKLPGETVWLKDTEAETGRKTLKEISILIYSGKRVLWDGLFSDEGMNL